jgi:Polyketide cyclase / dehydrase and lipid transport
VRRDGVFYVVHASGRVAADQRVAWDALTDYDHLSEFVPDIERSRVLVRDGNRLIVEHVGAFRLMFVAIPVRVRLAVEHDPYQRVVARTEPGKVGTEEPTLQSVASRYRLTPLPAPPGGVRVDYDARFGLGDMLPEFVDSLFGKRLVEHGLRRHFEAMLSEIERRQGTLTSLTGPR